MAIINTRDIQFEGLEQVFKICGRRQGMAALERIVADYVIEHSPEIALFLKDMEKYDKPKPKGKPGSNKNQSRPDDPNLNYFAPTKSLQTMLCDEWFDKVCSDKNKYPEFWRKRLISDLMESEYKTQIAEKWAKRELRLQIKGHVIGALIRAGVINKKALAVARIFYKTEENSKDVKTFAKYMGDNIKVYYSDWIVEYVKSPIEK